MQIKDAWTYDADGYLADSIIVQTDPKREGQWMLPPNCTLTPPGPKKDCFYQILDKNDSNSGWKEEAFPTSAADFIGVEIPHASRTKHHQDMRNLLRGLVKKEETKFREKSINDAAGNLIAITVEAIPEPTEAEKKAEKENAARSKRDYYLSLTDYLIQPDYPIEETKRAEVVAYRQQLRDIPQAENFPEDIVWPEPPAIAKSAHKAWKSEQVSEEINTKVEAVEKRTDLTEPQKQLLITELRKVSQQDSYPYDVEWPVEATVLATATE